MILNRGVTPSDCSFLIYKMGIKILLTLQNYEEWYNGYNEWIQCIKTANGGYYNYWLLLLFKKEPFRQKWELWVNRSMEIQISFKNRTWNKVLTLERPFLIVIIIHIRNKNFLPLSVHYVPGTMLSALYNSLIQSFLLPNWQGTTSLFYR